LAIEEPAPQPEPGRDRVLPAAPRTGGERGNQWGKRPAKPLAEPNKFGDLHRPWFYHLPEAVRLLLLKGDGTFMIWSDGGGAKVKPLNWMTPPTVIEDGGDVLRIRKHAGKAEDRLEIRLFEVLSDVEHDGGEASSLEKDGVERVLQLELAAQPAALGEELRLVKREWPTDIGPGRPDVHERQRLMGRRSRSSGSGRSTRSSSSAAIWSGSARSILPRRPAVASSPRSWSSPRRASSPSRGRSTGSRSTSRPCEEPGSPS
jgi:hypothetical protein